MTRQADVLIFSLRPSEKEESSLFCPALPSLGGKIFRQKLEAVCRGIWRGIYYRQKERGQVEMEEGEGKEARREQNGYSCYFRAGRESIDPAPRAPPPLKVEVQRVKQPAECHTAQCWSQKRKVSHQERVVCSK